MNLDILILFILLFNSVILLYIYFNLSSEKELLELMLKTYLNDKDKSTISTKAIETSSTEAIINNSNFIEVDP